MKSELLGLLGAMCFVVCFRWQCVLLGLLGGKMSWLVSSEAICIAGSFRWQCELSGLLCGNVCCSVF